MGVALDSPRGYSAVEFEFLLQALAYHAGNARRALAAVEAMDPAELDELGITKWPDQSTLHRWAKRYPEKYDATREKTLAPYRAKSAEAHSAAADEHLRVNQDALHRAEEKMDGMETKDLIALINHTGVQSGIHRDKAAGLRGENPGGFTVNLNINEQIRGMAAKGFPLYDKNNQPLTAEEAIKRVDAINGTATELPKETESVES